MKKLYAILQRQYYVQQDLMDDSPHTARDVMNNEGYYLKGRDKGVLTVKDTKCRTAFASKVLSTSGLKV